MFKRSRVDVVTVHQCVFKITNTVVGSFSSVSFLAVEYKNGNGCGKGVNKIRYTKLQLVEEFSVGRKRYRH